LFATAFFFEEATKVLGKTMTLLVVQLQWATESLLAPAIPDFDPPQTPQRLPKRGGNRDERCPATSAVVVDTMVASTCSTTTTKAATHGEAVT